MVSASWPFVMPKVAATLSTMTTPSWFISFATKGPCSAEPEKLAIGAAAFLVAFRPDGAAFLGCGARGLMAVMGRFSASFIGNIRWHILAGSSGESKRALWASLTG
jgi:hypothetical protein